MRPLTAILTAILTTLIVAPALGRAVDVPKPGSQPKSQPKSRPKGPPEATRPAPAVLDLGSFSLRPHPRWLLGKADSAMRKAVLVLPAPKAELEPAELIVYYFGAGGAGSAEANMARWKQMFARPSQLPPEKFARRKDQTVRGVAVKTVEIHGSYLGPSFEPFATPKRGYMMLAAVLDTEGGAHYLRAVGQEQTLEHWKPAWLELIASLEPKSKGAEGEQSGPPKKPGEKPTTRKKDGEA